MWKSKKFILVAVLAIIVLVGGTAGIVFAQNGSEGESQPKTLLARVAEILVGKGININQQDLEDAFAQTRMEMQDEALDRYLQKLVGDGKITDEQAGEYKAWLEAEPDTPLPGPFGHFGFHGFRSGMKWGGGHCFWGRALPAP